MRISVAKAAEMLGVSEQAVRVMMAKRQIDIGIVAGTKAKRTYIIFDEKVKALKGEK